MWDLRCAGAYVCDAEIGVVDGDQGVKRVSAKLFDAVMLIVESGILRSC